MIAQLPESRLQLESLEDRTLLSAAFPTNFEQYMVELINKARATPDAYAASLGITLNEGLAAGTISSAAKQPLAINPYLTDSAGKHSQWMLDVDRFSHTGLNGTSPTQRMESAGYVLQNGWSTGENIGYRGTTGTPDVGTYTKLLEESLFVDANIAGRGHRLNLMNDNFAEVGVGIRSGLYSVYNSVMATQDFGKSGPAMFLTGVAFSDAVTADNFYTPGEGLANITIEAIRDGNGARYSTTTWASGGYRLELPRGRYSIMAKGAALGASQFIASVNMGSLNMKRDFKVGWVRVAPEIAAQGNGLFIPNKDSTPRSVDNTDFGSVSVVGGTINKVFSVVNIGNGTLNLTDAQRITVSGPNSSDFVITATPSASIAGESSSSFSVQFNASASGLRTAIISIASNDANESPFTFTVCGTGLLSSSFLAQPTNSSSPSQASAVNISSFRAFASTPVNSRQLTSNSGVVQTVSDGLNLGHYAEALDLDSIHRISGQAVRMSISPALCQL